MRLINIIITLFILALVVILTTSDIRTKVLFMRYNTLRDKAVPVLDQKFAELNNKAIKADGKDSINILSHNYIMEWKYLQNSYNIKLIDKQANKVVFSKQYR